MHELPRSPRLHPLYEDSSYWYKDWYFHLRLDEELSRSVRHQLALSIIVIELVRPEKGRDKQLLKNLLSDITARKLRRSDIAGVLGRNEYGVLLPHTSIAQAEIVSKRLGKALRPFHAITGTASYPEDGAEPTQLLRFARERALVWARAA